MHKILVDTHREENIDLLKARDYYFDTAKRIERFKKFFVNLPAAILIGSYVVLGVLFFLKFRFSLAAYDKIDGFVNDYLEYIIGFVTITVFFISLVMDKVISERKEISNMLREEYDVRVFGLKKNMFAYNSKEKDIDKYLRKAKYVKDYYKYEVWYGEVFCDDRNKNILCCQMDNIIYTYYVYGDMYKVFVKKFIACVLLMAAVIVISLNLVNPFLVFFAFVEVLETVWDEISTCKEMKEKNEILINIVGDESKKDIIERDFPFYLRSLQDSVINNRNNALSAPKKIRKDYLKEGNIFYQRLDDIKKIYLDENSVTMPENADDLEILSMDESRTHSLSEIHKRLNDMLLDVIDILEKNRICYTLDGGTLIGAVRKNISGVETAKLTPDKWKDCMDYENGGFLFWDDDVDLAIPVNQIEKAKKVIREELGDRYHIQDYYTEEFYSPRLSNFRVREKNTKSRVAEKDSVLWEKYECKGLFLDIYAYSPILVNRFADRIFRRVLIHPIHKKIKSVEDDCRYSDHKKKSVQKFLRMKKRYMKRVEWYTRHAKNEKYYSYTPNFINDITQAGPYIKREYLYGEARTAKFEGHSFSVPTKPEEVLKSCYGEKWYQSPYSFKEDLVNNSTDGKWFSMAKCMTSVYKHIKRADLS